MAVKSPPIGRLRETGELQINTPTQQGAGKRDNYTTLITCRGQLTKLRGNRFLDAGETVIGSGWEWICREQAAINTVENKKSMRWAINGRMFSVNDYELIDQKNRYYRFLLLENE